MGDRVTSCARHRALESAFPVNDTAASANAATLDYEELELYILALVRECDRLEWVLTGEDRF